MRWGGEDRRLPLDSQKRCAAAGAVRRPGNEIRATHAPGFGRNQERGPRLRARPAIGRVGMAYAIRHSHQRRTASGKIRGAARRISFGVPTRSFVGTLPALATPSRMIVALVLFALAAVGGLVLALQRFSGKPLPSLPLALGHGAAAASGLVILIVFVTGEGGPSGAKVALGLFLVAALGGFVLFSRHLRKASLPIPLIVVHALVAVAGFVTLLITALRRSGQSRWG
jgi:hypothetical protein